MKQNILLLILLIFSQSIFSQTTDCDKITLFLNEKEAQIAKLNLHDPDCIPLHYLFAKDIIKELEQFKNEDISRVTACSTEKFSEIINKFDALKNSVQLKYDSLRVLKENVYLIFYEKARSEYQFKNEADGDYYLQRALQYNATFPDAILLKLNKLLDKKRFEECLSLLNILYYETEMDTEQEKQAIAFTDKFYNILYYTGDALVKSEHAAEALVLFEILETFCLNLPTAYCNDDYFHGVLRSKSGIYESYITIAKEAEKRGNPKIAAHFYQYAQEYAAANPNLKEYEPVMEERNATAATPVSTVQYVSNIPAVENKVARTKDKVVHTEDKVARAEEKSEPKLSSKEIKTKYDNMVSQGLALCLREKFIESYKMFLEAKKLEECACFQTDFRVDLMIHELSKFVGGE